MSNPKSDKELGQELLRLQNEFDQMLAALDFYVEAIDMIMTHQESGSTQSVRQKHGLHVTGNWLIDTGEKLSKEIEAIKKLP
jgi:hypothetical protein